MVAAQELPAREAMYHEVQVVARWMMKRYPHLRAYAEKHCGSVDDGVQEACEKFLRSGERVLGSGFKLSTIAGRSTWYALSKAAKQAKSASRRCPGLKPIDENVKAPTTAEQAEARQLVADILPQLHPSHREVLVRHYFGEETMREIADTKGVTFQRVQQIQAKALVELRTLAAADVLPEGIYRHQHFPPGTAVRIDGDERILKQWPDGTETPLEIPRMWAAEFIGRGDWIRDGDLTFQKGHRLPPARKPIRTRATP